jgi:hypothetical protein
MRIASCMEDKDTSHPQGIMPQKAGFSTGLFP